MYILGMTSMYHGNLEKLAGKTVEWAGIVHDDEMDMDIPIIRFTDGTEICCMRDDEGNGSGSVWMQFPEISK